MKSPKGLLEGSYKVVASRLALRWLSVSQAYKCFSDGRYEEGSSGYLVFKLYAFCYSWKATWGEFSREIRFVDFSVIFKI